MRVLVVEDDLMLAASLQEGLERHGFSVDLLPDGSNVERELASGSAFDLAIVDLGLPGIDGLTLIRNLRRAGYRLPVLILTARDGLDDCVRGLDCGADDYMIKPFRLPELAARARALIRRANSALSAVLEFNELRLDTTSRQAQLGAAALELTPREWTILEALLLQHPKVVIKERLVQSLAGWDKDITANAVEVHISRLRAKLDRSAISVRAVRGIGYRLERK